MSRQTSQEKAGSVEQRHEAGPPQPRRSTRPWVIAVFPLVVAVAACGLAVTMLVTRGPSTAEVADLREESRTVGYKQGMAATEERMKADLEQAASDAKKTGEELGHRAGVEEGERTGRELGYAEGEAAGYEGGSKQGYAPGASAGFTDGQAVEPEMTPEERMASYDDAF